MALAGRRLGSPRSRCSFIGDEGAMLIHCNRGATTKTGPFRRNPEGRWGLRAISSGSASQGFRIKSLVNISTELGELRSAASPALAPTGAAFPPAFVQPASRKDLKSRLYPV